MPLTPVSWGLDMAVMSELLLRNNLENIKREPHARARVEIKKKKQKARNQAKSKRKIKVKNG